MDADEIKSEVDSIAQDYNDDEITEWGAIERIGAIADELADTLEEAAKGLTKPVMYDDIQGEQIESYLEQSDQWVPDEEHEDAWRHTGEGGLAHGPEANHAQWLEIHDIAADEGRGGIEVWLEVREM